MPANLTPDYRRAEERFRAAKTVEDKIAALEEMLRVMPKHKGTDGLQGDVKARLAKLRKQPAKKGTHAAVHLVVREGAGQVSLVGPTNTGKSALVSALTHAKPEVAAWPFTTREATPGMMRFQDVGIQLVDLPPLGEEHVEPWVWDMARRADLLWIVVTPENAFDEHALVVRLLASKAIDALPARVPRPEAGAGGRVQRPALVVLTGADRPGATQDAEIVDQLLEGNWPIVCVSATTGAGLELLARRTFAALDQIRVYTKQPGKHADRSAPFTLDRGSTVGDLAERIHKDVRAAMKFARVWGPSAYDGQSVHADHVLAEGDVVEIHV
jgi:ribosome-interacting GTPase 1